MKKTHFIFKIFQRLLFISLALTLFSHVTANAQEMKTEQKPKAESTQEKKMLLSLKDTITMALENNLDISIQRYLIPISQTDVLRSSGGQVLLDVLVRREQGDDDD